MMESHPHISRDQAELEFATFCEEHALDLTTNDTEERENLKRHTDRIINAMMIGTVYLNSNNQLVLRAENEELVFHEPTGNNVVEMDRAKGDMAKVNRLLAAVCMVDPSVIGKMKSRYLKVAQAIVTLFMS